ncbi:MAG: FHA domain-containing protein [Gemmatimonadaceae bacterium]
MTSPPSPPSPSTAPERTACSFCGRDNASAAQFCSDCGKPLQVSAARVPPTYSADRVSASAMPSGQVTTAGDKCRKCGKGVGPEVPFCAHCGTRIADKIEEGMCPGCGAGYAKGSDLFCAKCGYRVGERVSLVTKAVGGNTAAFGSGMRLSGPRIAVLDERGEPNKVFMLDRGEAVIGRGEADLKFEYDVYLSPLHARVDLREGSLWLRDLGSRNGSWVFIDEPTKLVDADLILIGSQVLRFRRLGYPGPHPPEADSTRRMGSVTPPVDVAVLEQLRADGSVRDAFHLSPGRTAILGRESGDWIFPYDQTMSGRHAEIVSEDIEFFVQDAGSRNGVAMSVRGDRELKKGQRFLMGDQILRVENI